MGTLFKGSGSDEVGTGVAAGSSMSAHIRRGLAMRLAKKALVLLFLAAVMVVLQSCTVDGGASYINPLRLIDPDSEEDRRIRSHDYFYRTEQQLNEERIKWSTPGRERFR